jgi:KaiC/GvpD/RAD55 family RecA-like ATPase
MEFLVRGATKYDEPGVFVAFEETSEQLAQNFASLGFDLKDLVARKKLLLDYISFRTGKNPASLPRCLPVNSQPSSPARMAASASAWSKFTP